MAAPVVIARERSPDRRMNPAARGNLWRPWRGRGRLRSTLALIITLVVSQQCQPTAGFVDGRTELRHIVEGPPVRQNTNRITAKEATTSGQASSGDTITPVAEGGMSAASASNNDNNNNDNNNLNHTSPLVSSLQAQLTASPPPPAAPSMEVDGGESVIKFPLYMRLIATFACLIIFTVGVCGNLLVPLVVIKTKYLRNSTNLFLINLSIADLLVLIVCMPTVLIELHSRPETWLLGEAMCKLSNFVEMLAAHGSIFTILAISFERYYAICKPLKAGYKCTRLRATIIICVIWLLSCILTSPILIMAKSAQTTYIDGSLVYNCILEMDTYWHRLYVFVAMFAFFWLPLLVLMLVYWLISRRLIRETVAMMDTHQRPEHHGALHHHHHQQQQPHQATTYHHCSTTTTMRHTSQLTSVFKKHPNSSHHLSLAARQPAQYKPLLHFLNRSKPRPDCCRGGGGCCCGQLDAARAPERALFNQRAPNLLFARSSTSSERAAQRSATPPGAAANKRRQRLAAAKLRGGKALSLDCQRRTRSGRESHEFDYDNHICASDAQHQKRPPQPDSPSRTTCQSASCWSAGGASANGQHHATNHQSAIVDASTTATATTATAAASINSDGETRLRSAPTRARPSLLARLFLADRAAHSNSLLSRLFHLANLPATAASSSPSTASSTASSARLSERELANSVGHGQRRCCSGCARPAAGTNQPLEQNDEEDALNMSSTSCDNKLINSQEQEQAEIDGRGQAGPTSRASGQKLPFNIANMHSRLMNAIINKPGHAAGKTRAVSARQRLQRARDGPINGAAAAAEANNETDQDERAGGAPEGERPSHGRSTRAADGDAGHKNPNSAVGIFRLHRSGSAGQAKIRAGLGGSARHGTRCEGNNHKRTMAHHKRATTSDSSAKTRLKCMKGISISSSTGSTYTNSTCLPSETGSASPSLHIGASNGVLCGAAARQQNSPSPSRLAAATRHATTTTTSTNSRADDEMDDELGPLVESGREMSPRKIMTMLPAGTDNGQRLVLTDCFDEIHEDHQLGGEGAPRTCQSRQIVAEMAAVFHGAATEAENVILGSESATTTPSSSSGPNNHADSCRPSWLDALVYQERRNQRRSSIARHGLDLHGIHDDEDDKDDGGDDGDEFNKQLNGTLDLRHGENSAGKREGVRIRDDDDDGDDDGQRVVTDIRDMRSTKKPAKQQHRQWVTRSLTEAPSSDIEEARAMVLEDEDDDAELRINHQTPRGGAGDESDSRSYASSLARRDMSSRHASAHSGHRLISKATLLALAGSLTDNLHHKRKGGRSGSQPVISNRLMGGGDEHSHHHHHNSNNNSSNSSSGLHSEAFIAVRDISKKQQMDSRRQVVAMLFFVVACFFLLFFPYRVFTMWLILSTDDQVQSLGMETYYNLTYFSRILIYLHSAINPIAYNLISTKFRRAFMSILLCRGASTRRKFNLERGQMYGQKNLANTHNHYYNNNYNHNHNRTGLTSNKAMMKTLR